MIGPGKVQKVCCKHTLHGRLLVFKLNNFLHLVDFLNVLKYIEEKSLGALSWYTI